MPATRTADDIMAELSAVIDGAEGRSLTGDEIENYEALEGELASTRRDGEVRARHTAYETPVRAELPTGGGDAPPRHPLAYTREALDALDATIRARRPGRFAAGGNGLDEITNATVTTTLYGQPAEWGANLLVGPRLLHVVAGVERQPVDAALVEHPKLTLPTATAGVSEGTTVGEYDDSTAGTVTLLRFGRFTDLSAESQLGTSTGPLIAMHQLGVALDLDDALIGAAETAAADVGFTADVPAAIRGAMAEVIANTALDDVGRLIILVNPDNVGLLQDVTPIGGASIGEGFSRFSGALVYPSNSVTTAFITVANLQAGARYFEAQGTLTETDKAVKTGVSTVATSLIGGYGIGLVSGFAVQVDVVTP